MSTNKPPSRLPDGRQNPAYKKWLYNNASPEDVERRKQRRIACAKKWNSSAKCKEARDRYYNTEKGKAALKKAAASNELTRACVDCGIRYRSEDVMQREYRLIGKYKCLCEYCA